MKKLVAAVLLNIFLFAQTAPFEEFLVGFWPEYDHPGVLITIEMITPVDQLPVDFNIKLPAEANMALRSIDNPAGEKELVHQLINTEKGYNIMPVHVDQSKFYIQFYYNPFGTDNAREFSYDLDLDLDIDHYHVIIQELVGCEDFKTSLAAPEIIKDDFGFTYHRSHMDNLKANQPVTVEFSYVNVTGKTSVDAMREIMNEHTDFMGTSQGMGQNEQSEFPGTNKGRFKYYLMILIPLIVILIVFLGRKSSISTKTDPVKPTQSLKFCTGCGSKLEGTSKFCTTCGKETHVS